MKNGIYYQKLECGNEQMFMKFTGLTMFPVILEACLIGW